VLGGGAPPYGGALRVCGWAGALPSPFSPYPLPLFPLPLNYLLTPTFPYFHPSYPLFGLNFHICLP